MSKYYLGIMCGTSLDSIDISIIKASGNKINVANFREYELSQSYKNRINESKSKNKTDKKLDDDLSKLLSLNIEDILKQSKLQSENISAIGYSGITLNHRPDLGLSTYIGNPKLLKNLTSIPVVADFRQTNIDAGGQGAPLTGFFHEYLNSSSTVPITFLNLGGFANLSIKDGKDLISYDTGPANYLIDLWCRERLDIEFDLGGVLSSMGEVDKELLESMLRDKYFKQKPPKSTGFELFNMKWVQDKLDQIKSFKDIDILSTLSELTIISIATEILKYKNAPKKIFFYGGGSLNRHITDKILELTNFKRVYLKDMGVNEKNLESTTFAWLAMMRMEQKLFDNPSITGSKESHLLGKIY